MMLQRYSSTFTLTAISKKSNPPEEEPVITELGPEFDVGFISHSQSCSFAVTQNVVRSGETIALLFINVTL